MSSTKNSSKVVRTESILDEYSIYFSHVLSPLRKMKKSKKPKMQQQQQQQQQQYYGGSSRGVDEGDVDDEAEDFIKKRHQKFVFTKWISRSSD